MKVGVGKIYLRKEWKKEKVSTKILKIWKVKLI